MAPQEKTESSVKENQNLILIMKMNKTEGSDRDLEVQREGREIAMIIDEEEDETKMIVRGDLVVEGLDLDLVGMQPEGTNLLSSVNYSCRENVLKVLKTAYIAITPNHQKSWNCVNSIS